MTIFFVVIALANIALPLTNGFAGEFLMFNGLLSAQSNYKIVFTLVAGLGIILSAVYTLNMIRKTFYGEAVSLKVPVTDLKLNERLALGLVVIIILWLGIYPQSLLDVTSSFSKEWFSKIDVSYLFRK